MSSAGADIIFPEALLSVSEFEKFRSQISSPLMANMTEFGKTDIIPYKIFKSLNYNIVIYPVSAWRLALKAVDKGLTVLSEDKQKDLLPQMQSRQELYELLKYESYNTFDGELFNFFSKKDRPILFENSGSYRREKIEKAKPDQYKRESLFEVFREKILKLNSSIRENKTKTYYSYYSYVASRDAFLYVLPQRGRLRLYIGLRIEDIQDPKNKIKDARDEHFGKCDVRTDLNSLEELSYIMPYIHQAFKKQGM